MCPLLSPLFFFFFNDTATTEIYTLSLHDALPISLSCHLRVARPAILAARRIHLALLTLTGLFVVTVLAQVGENPCFFAFLFEALERTLKALVIVNDDFRHKPRFS